MTTLVSYWTPTRPAGGWSVIRAVASSYFRFSIEFTCKGGGGRLLDARPAGPGVVGYSGMDGRRALVTYMGGFYGTGPSPLSAFYLNLLFFISIILKSRLGEYEKGRQRGS